MQRADHPGGGGTPVTGSLAGRVAGWVVRALGRGRRTNDSFPKPEITLDFIPLPSPPTRTLPHPPNRMQAATSAPPEGYTAVAEAAREGGGDTAAVVQLVARLRGLQLGQPGQA